MRSKTTILRLGCRLFSAALLPSLLVLAACQSDDDKVASFMQNGSAYAEAGKQKEAVIEYRNALQLRPNDPTAHYELSKSYLALRKGREAYWELSETVRLNAENIEARLTYGGLALIAGDFDEALIQAEATMELAPENGSAHILRGKALERLERESEAEADYLRAVEIESEEGSYLMVLAGYYARQGDRLAAEPILRKYTEIDPAFLSFTALGRFLSEDRDRDEDTQAAFELALETASEENRVPAYQNLANFLAARGSMNEAKPLLERAIEETDSDEKLDLIYLLARMHRAGGDDAAANSLIELATSALPGSVKPHLILSAHRGRQGDLPGALEAAEDALSIDPDDTKARLRKAELLVDMGYRASDEGLVAEGLAIVDDVLASEPTNPDALFVKGKAALARSDTDAAVKSLHSAIDVRPGWSQAHFVLGSALALDGDTQGARASVARAVELDASLFEARRLLAKLHASLGEHEYAVEQGRVYLRRYPNHLKTRILVAQSLVRIGRTADAMVELDKIPPDQWNAEIVFARARLLQATGSGAEALKLFVRADQMSPYTPEILESLLALETRRGQVEVSAARINAAVEAKPENVALVRLKAALALAQRDMAGAEANLKRAIGLDPTSIATYRQLATLYQVTGRLGESLEIYKRALEQEPESAHLHHLVAVLYEMGGRIDAAMEEYARAIELNDELGEAKNNLAYLLAESGNDLDRALDLAQSAKALMPDNPNAADTLGWALYKRGISSAAVGYLKEAVAGTDLDSPNLGVIRHHLAQAYEGNSQKDEAIESLEIALADLERKSSAARARGDDPVEPPWSVAARQMLKRLRPAG